MKLTADDHTLVRAVPLLAGLSEAVLAGLLDAAEVTQHPAGMVLFSQDEVADRFFVLLDGWVKLYRLTEEGGEAIINIVARGEPFAEAAMFGTGRFPVGAEAITPIRLLTLTRDRFARTMAEHPGMAFAMLGSMSVRLRLLVRQVEQLQLQSAPERVAGFLLRFCPAAGDQPLVLQLPVHKALIARRLGMRPETFSRALAKLAAIGVQTEEGRVVIASPGRLRQFCQKAGPDRCADPVAGPWG